MKIKSEKDFWSGLMFVVVGAGFAWGALNYSFGTSARPGPAYFPFGLGIILAILGALILFESLTIEVEGGEKIGAWPFKPALWILGGVVVFGLALPRLGLAITLPLLIAIASVGGGEFHWKEVLITAALLTVGSWLIFIKGLGLTIPLWPPFVSDPATISPAAAVGLMIVPIAAFAAVMAAARRPAMVAALGSPLVFALLYVLFMLPTYALPWLGSNSTIVNAYAAAVAGTLNPLFHLHLAALILLVGLAWFRGSLIGRRWLVVFPLLAAMFDLLPGLSLIPMVPTVMHLLAIVLGVALSARPAAATR